MATPKEIANAVTLLIENGYIVRKRITKPLARAGSLKRWRQQHDEPKVKFTCFKSRLRYAGILKEWHKEDMQILRTLLYKQ